MLSRKCFDCSTAYILKIAETTVAKICSCLLLRNFLFFSSKCKENFVITFFCVVCLLYSYNWCFEGIKICVEFVEISLSVSRQSLRPLVVANLEKTSANQWLKLVASLTSFKQNDKNKLLQVILN